MPKIEIGIFQYIVWESLFSIQWVKNICCGYSLGALGRGTFSEYPQHLFLWRNKKLPYNYHQILLLNKSCVKVYSVSFHQKIIVLFFFFPGMHNTTLYTTYNMFNLNICYVCGSYQCPYCPFFNVATAIKASFTLIALILGFLLKKYILRNS